MVSKGEKVALRLQPHRTSPRQILREENWNIKERGGGGNLIFKGRWLLLFLFLL